MLKRLKLKNVGPAPTMELDFGDRLNLLTGDNGLGKSFLLDIAWWALTRKWPAEVNHRLTSGQMARPVDAFHGEKATIEFAFKGAFNGMFKSRPYLGTFERQVQAWTGRSGRPAIPGLVLYAQVDGSFALWDPARNYWWTKGKVDVQERLPAYVFSPREVWNGLRNENSEDKEQLCNGLINDWAKWQYQKGTAFDNLCSILTTLSPSDEERIEPGELTRISLDDPRDIPTLKMPYGQTVPVLYASAGMRRIIALAYLLIWSWEEHKRASKILDQKTTSQIIFLIDEVEAHLHPKWQRRIMKALLKVFENLTKETTVQIIASTHSPIVMASVEPFFDQEKDAWFDLDFETEGKEQRVIVTKRDFELHGDVSNWLTSEAFDLASSRSLESEKLLAEASKLIKKPQVTAGEIKDMYQRLLVALSPKDSFLFRWRTICEKKGWLR